MNGEGNGLLAHGLTTTQWQSWGGVGRTKVAAPLLQGSLSIHL